MKHEEKINYMRIAAGMVGYGFDEKGLDTLVSLYELIIEKKGESSLNDVVEIEQQAKKRDDIKRQSEMLDKVSKKID